MPPVWASCGNQESPETLTGDFPARGVTLVQDTPQIQGAHLATRTHFTSSHKPNTAGAADEETEAGTVTVGSRKGTLTPNHSLRGRSEHQDRVSGTPQDPRDVNHFPPIVWHLAPNWMLRNLGLSEIDPKTQTDPKTHVGPAHPLLFWPPPCDGRGVSPAPSSAPTGTAGELGPSCSTELALPW